MQYTILLNKNEKTREIEAQEQARFIKSVLEALEVPIEWNPEEPLTIEKKIELRKAFATYNINIISDNDGGLKILANNERIGEWYKCGYKLKNDPKQEDRSKKLYLEMTVNFWTIFENNE